MTSAPAGIGTTLVTLIMVAFGISRDAPVQGSRRARDVAARIDLAGILLPMTAVSAIMMGPISKRNLVRGPQSLLKENS
jgi:hypothetical protein